MIINAEKSWYIIYTKPKCEKKVAETLAKKNIDHYLPLVYKTHGKKVTGEPLFSAYVFVNTSAQQLQTIKSISGVLNLLYWLGSPAVVQSEEIASIKDFLHRHSNVQVEKSNVSVGDTVKIIQGASMHRQGRIVQISNNTVRTELPSIGYALIARVNAFVTENATSYLFSEVSEK